MENVRSLILFYLLTAFPPDTAFSSVKPQELMNGMAKHMLTYQELLWRIEDFTHAALRSAVSRMQQEGLLVTEQRQGRTLIRLTASGREAGLNFYPGLDPIRPKWDKTWRVVVFSHMQQVKSSAEGYRTLRTLLRRYNFAKLERGVYISPFAVPSDLKQAIGAARVFGICVLLETKRFVLGDELQFSSQAWNLEERTKSYAKVSKYIETMLIRMHTQNALNESYKIQFLSIVRKFSPILMHDFPLPAEIFPLEKAARQTVTDFFKLHSQIIDKDPAHF
jgi:DNA-binding transcriptional regulator PaaX